MTLQLIIITSAAFRIMSIDIAGICTRVFCLKHFYLIALEAVLYCYPPDLLFIRLFHGWRHSVCNVSLKSFTVNTKAREHKESRGH